MGAVPHPSFRIAAGLLAIATASLTANAAADPYQVEVVVFAREVDPAALPETNDHRPGCLARAQTPARGAGAPGAPSAVGPERLQLAAEAQALQRSSAGLRLLAHTAWQQDVPAAASGPWVRIGDRSGQGLAGCLRAKLTPVPEIEIDLIHETATGERHSLFGTARIRPGGVHYFDHPALGTLVRLDALTPTAAGATGDDAARPPAAAPAATPPPAAESSPGKAATPGAPEPPPPPPKKPFRW
jgi:hypothetical protein